MQLLDRRGCLARGALRRVGFGSSAPTPGGLARRFPMPVQDDVAAARDAVRALERAVAAVAGHYPQSVDARRLQSDVARVAEDLHLLAGQPPTPPPPTRLEVIDDRVYPQDFWVDADDESMGGGHA